MVLYLDMGTAEGKKKNEKKKTRFTTVHVKTFYTSPGILSS